MRLRLASYNIQKAVGLDLRRDPARTLAVINALDADVVVLQEADKRLGMRPSALPRFLIEQQTDYIPADVAEADVSLGWHGNAVLVRRGWQIVETDRLPLPGLEPRGAVKVRIARANGPAHLQGTAGAASGAPAALESKASSTGTETDAPAAAASTAETTGITIIGVHLALIRRWRRRQARALHDYALRGHAPRTIIAGDFNEWSMNKGLGPLSPSFEIVTPGRTFPASRPVGPLDRAALGQSLTLIRAEVADDRLARIASDHRPVLFDLVST